jgi:hypothetical protein
MKSNENKRKPLASPGELALALFTVSFFALLLAPSLLR